jgi:DNA-binding transcriptional MerR regulator
MTGLTVSQVAARAGTSPDTVRYYERAGLLQEPARTPVGYRVYGDDSVERLQFIRGAQRFGLRLREIRELLEILDRGQCPCGHTEALVRRRLAELGEKMAELAEMRQRLLRLAEEYPARACPEGSEPWLCGAELVRQGGKER